jgi:protein-tyrosine phosphatase
MAERLLTAAVAEAAGVSPEEAGELVHSHSAGTGGWHAGEQMHPSAAHQLRVRGADPDRFVARRLRSDQLDAADMILVSTADQRLYVTALRPEAASRTFVLGELGRLLRRVDQTGLPPAEATPERVAARGAALVAALEEARGGAAPQPGDDLDDPWGRGEQTFARVGDEIAAVLRPLAAALVSAS